MNQRAVALLNDYLSQRPKGRIVRVAPTSVGSRPLAAILPGEPDYFVAIEDVRDGRVHVVQTAEVHEARLRCSQLNRSRRSTRGSARSRGGPDRP